MRIGLLGTLSVHDQAGRPVRVGGYMVRVLLVLLAIDAGRVVPAYSLIERLWEDDPPAGAGNALQSLVSRLRTALRRGGLGDRVIESHPAGYRLAIAPDAVDIAGFEALARAGNRALASGDPAGARRALREALELWRGPALADASGLRFAAGPAARLEELRTRAALDLAEAALALGEADSVTGELRAMIAADPVAERPRGLLMRALYHAGRQAEALAVYAQTRELLAGELGVDPSPQLEEIYLGVLRQDLPEGSPAGPPPDAGPAAAPGVADSGNERIPGAPPPRPAAVRQPLTSFVGRDEDVARVLKMLAVGRLVTLTGPGGAGKTRLALETAARLAGESPLGIFSGPATSGQAPPGGGQVWFVELIPVTDPDEVPSAVLNALGIRESPVLAHAGTGQLAASADPAQRLVTALAGRRDLLVLDNCEHVVAAAAQLADQVLAGCPGVRVLVTSREPLRITGETLWPVAPLPVPPAPAEDPGPGEPGRTAEPDGPVAGAGHDGGPRGAAGIPVAGYASVRLLADRAAAVRPGFRVDASNAADVARICRALDGMPLAIELAAARLRTLSAAQLAERLGARFDLLTGGSRTAEPRHQTLRAVVAWSWDLLSGAEQVLARRLAVFPAGATLAAAEQVCAGSGLPVEEILPALFGLVEKSFIVVIEKDEPRYRMLETIRAYCAERLTDAGEDETARQAFATYFLRLAEAADPLLRGAGQQTWMRRLTAEQDNVHAALRWAIVRRDTALALRFGQALGWFWLLRGQRRESGAIATEILALGAPAGNAAGLDVPHARAICALTAVNSHWDLSAVREPLAAVQHLMTRKPEAAGGDCPPHPLVVVGAVMVAFYEERDPDLALGLLAGQFSSADPWTRVGTRLMHAFFSVSLGRLDGVADRCAEALAGFEALGDRWGMALALVGQAELATLDGRHERAIAALERAVTLSRELTDWEEMAQVYASLAKSRGRIGDHRGALADMERAERVCRERGESESDIWIRYIRAELAWLHGDVAEAGRISHRLDDWMAGRDTAMISPFRAQVLGRAALADIRTGATEQGWAGLATALRLAAESQHRSAVAVVLDALASALLWPDHDPAGAERAAVLLGAAHTIRGAFDHSSLDAPGARDTARQALGEQAFGAAYRRGQELSFAQAMRLAEDCLPPPASR